MSKCHDYRELPMPYLSLGDKRFEVCLLKALLRTTRDKSPHCFNTKINDIFDFDTENEVISFQESKGIEPTGIVDPITYRALIDGRAPLLIRDYSDSIVLVPQEDEYTCWVAATSMMTSAKRDDIISHSPKEIRWATNGLHLETREGGPDYAEKYARIHKLILHTWEWSVSYLCTAIAKGPLLFMNSYEGLEDAIDEEGKKYQIDYHHAIVISGVISDNEPSGFGTFLQIHDPCPIGKGSIHWMYYVDIASIKLPRNLAFFFSRDPGVSYPIAYSRIREDDVLYLTDMSNCPPPIVLSRNNWKKCVVDVEFANSGPPIP